MENCAVAFVEANGPSDAEYLLPGVGSRRATVSIQSE
jgi:hypothetical protein